ncbi:MAG: MFS transporter, partial [Actinomadura rubrobrunea]|nr:MFS transporter [Actinomadura rubrobrunea]
LGGLLTDAFGWRWVFFTNVPIGLLAIVGTVRLLADDPGIGLRRGADASGGALITAGGMLTVYTIVQIEAHGWAAARTLGLAAGSLALLAAFAARQATAAAPLMPLRILRVRNVWGANAVQMLLVAAMFGFQIHMALYLQRVRGYDATETGLALMPAAIVIGGVSLTVSGRLIARFGERAVLVSGLITMFAGYALLTRLSVDTAYATHVLPATLLFGGFGLALPALTALGMSSAGQDDAGVASGVFNTTQQIGAALGVAVLSTFAASRTAHLRDDEVPEALALTGGYRLAFGVGAGLLVAAIVLGLLVLRRVPVERRS